MPIHITSLVLFAALLHTTWNALLRGGSDRLWLMTIMCLAVAIASAITALFMAASARANWPYAMLSALLHLDYNLFLGAQLPRGRPGANLSSGTGLFADPDHARCGDICRGACPGQRIDGHRPGIRRHYFTGLQQGAVGVARLVLFVRHRRFHRYLEHYRRYRRAPVRRSDGLSC